MGPFLIFSQNPDPDRAKPCLSTFNENAMHFFTFDDAAKVTAGSVVFMSITAASVRSQLHVRSHKAQISCVARPRVAALYACLFDSSSDKNCCTQTAVPATYSVFTERPQDIP